MHAIERTYERPAQRAGITLSLEPSQYVLGQEPVHLAMEPASLGDSLEDDPERFEWMPSPVMATCRHQAM